jgi:hypothetical protein
MTETNETLKINLFKAPLLSAFVLPGLGQALNNQIAKGLILMALITVIFLALLAKVLLGLSSSFALAMGPDMILGPNAVQDIILGFRGQNHTLTFILLGAGVIIWSYSITDAFLVALKKKKLARI